MTLYRLKKFDWAERPSGAWVATVPIRASVHPPDEDCPQWWTWYPGAEDADELPSRETASEAMAAVERLHYAGIMESLEPAEVSP